jgi:hypothetical protein
MSYSFGKSIVTDGLVFYVDAANGNSYSGSGTTWSDLVGNTDGTLKNTPTFDSGDGGSFYFNGSNEYTDIKSLVIPANITVSAWINPSATTSAGQILTSDDSAVSIRNWQFLMEADNKIRAIGFHTSGNQNLQFVTTDTIPDDTWTMVSFTSDGTNIKIQFNGVEKATGSFPYSLLGNGSTGDALIGARKSSSLAAFFNGKIAVVQVYDRALSSTEILQNYNALKNRFI